MSITLLTPAEVKRGIAERFKSRRLVLNMTQEELAARSGVAWSSLKRFEREGLISLDSLLHLALALDCLQDFETLAAGNQGMPIAQSLDALLAAAPKPRRRASRRKGRKP